VSSAGGTAHAERTVVFDSVSGTVLLDVADPSGDDNGPGNYAYPTAADFHPGAFDLQRFLVIDSGSDVVFRVQTRDLSPTFGSPLGAQLVDVYVHVPGAATTSTAASFSQRNYPIAPGFAWSRLVEVQGFRVPKASLGTPGPGWGFTVVLAGQDGFSPDQARGFASTPQPYVFGVCAAASSDPHCTVDPASVPKAIDVVAPAGVSQSVELDYTLAPVVLAGVTIS
jgi:carbohydrate-binding DOMON domain-containing protein